MTDTTRAPSRAQLVAEEAQRRVTQLQRAYLADQSAAVATLARLRRCDAADAGADPTVWEITIGGLPEELAGRDDVSPAERSIHAALVLYANHQQSNTAAMHQPGVGLGRAVRKLADARGRDGAADESSIRRLHQVALAADPAARLYHLRSLISMLRSEAEPIGLDYGLLAADLFRLLTQQTTGQSVIARWGRELHSRPNEPTTGEPK